MTVHPIPPVYDCNSRILILGSFPSVRSRESSFFYGHPQNRFWKVISGIYGGNEPVTIEEKREYLLKNRIALWDVIASCDITGSADSSIKNVIANDISLILKNADIQRIYLNGRTAERYYYKFIGDKAETKAFCLPSTSPANAAWSIQALIEKWKIIKAEVE